MVRTAAHLQRFQGQLRLIQLAGFPFFTVTCSVFVCSLLVASQSETRLGELYSSAQAAQARGDYRAASTLYGEILKLRPELSEAWANLGLMHQFLGEYQIADQHFRTALRKNPKLYVPNLFLGLNLLRAHKPAAAISYLEQAERINPRDVQVTLGLARAYEGTGDTGKAQGAFHRATEVAPHEPDAWYGLGVTCLNLQKSAVEQLRLLGSESAYARSLVAEAFLEQGRPNDAIQIYIRLLDDRNHPPCLRSALGSAYLQAGKLTFAAEMFEEDLSRGPGCSQARLGQAALALAQGDWDGAFRELGIVWEVDRNFLAANLNRLWNSLQPQRVYKWRAYLERVPSPSTRSEMATSLLDSIHSWESSDMTESGLSPVSQYSQSRKDSSASSSGLHQGFDPERLTDQDGYTGCVARLKPNLAEHSLPQSLLLARCAYYTADYVTSLLASGKALQLDSRNLPALYWKAKSAEKLAIYALVRTSTEAPNSFRTHLLLGEIHRSKEEYKAAELEFAKVIALKPDDPTAHLGLARVHYANTRYTEALTELKPVLKADPANPEAAFLMGQILVKQRQFSDAVPYLKVAFEGPPFIIPRVHSLLATCYAAQGLIDQAISELKPALPADLDGVFHYQIYRLYRQQGNNDAAQSALQRSEMLRKSAAREQQKLIEESIDQ